MPENFCMEWEIIRTLHPSHKEFEFSFLLNKLKLDCIYHFLIDSVLNQKDGSLVANQPENIQSDLTRIALCVVYLIHIPRLFMKYKTNLVPVKLTINFFYHIFNDLNIFQESFFIIISAIYTLR